MMQMIGRMLLFASVLAAMTFSENSIADNSSAVEIGRLRFRDGTFPESVTFIGEDSLLIFDGVRYQKFGIVRKKLKWIDGDIKPLSVKARLGGLCFSEGVVYGVGNPVDGNSDWFVSATVIKDGKTEIVNTSAQPPAETWCGPHGYGVTWGELGPKVSFSFLDGRVVANESQPRRKFCNVVWFDVTGDEVCYESSGEGGWDFYNEKQERIFSTKKYGASGYAKFKLSQDGQYAAFKTKDLRAGNSDFFLLTVNMTAGDVEQRIKLAKSANMYDFAISGDGRRVAMLIENRIEEEKTYWLMVFEKNK